MLDSLYSILYELIMNNNIREIIVGVLIIGIPTYTVAMITQQMVFTVPTLAIALVIVSKLEGVKLKGNITRIVDSE